MDPTFDAFGKAGCILEHDSKGRIDGWRIFPAHTHTRLDRDSRGLQDAETSRQILELM